MGRAGFSRRFSGFLKSQLSAARSRRSLLSSSRTRCPRSRLAALVRTHLPLPATAVLAQSFLTLVPLVVGCVGAVEEPDSIELDSDVEYYDGDNEDASATTDAQYPAAMQVAGDAAVTDVAHPYFPAGGSQSWMDVTDTLATGTDGNDADASSNIDIAPASVAAKLLPSAMDMQVACTVENESASSGRLYGWRCDSCNFVSSGLSSTCELCSAERGNLPCEVAHSAEAREQHSSAGCDTYANAAAQDSNNTWLEHARDDGGISIDLTGASDSPGVSGELVVSRSQRNDSAGTSAVTSSEPKHQKKQKRRRVEIEVALTEPSVIPTATATSVMSHRQQPVWVSSGSSSAALVALGSGPLADRSTVGANILERKHQKQKQNQQHKQPDRRKAASDFKNGIGPLPPVTLNIDETVPACEVKVGGLHGSDGLVVHWPRDMRPSRPQLQLMRHAAAALSAGRHALLESPTGTGKTLALLSTCLATQWARQTARHAADEPYSQRLVYVSRTHAQLDQVTRELRRLPYRPMMSLLASRERFCLHADVSRADDKAAACADATHVGKMCCTHLDRAEDINYPQAPQHRANYLPGGKLAVYDIEEIVKDNEANHVCPFHATRDLMTGGGDEKKGWSSALILITYTQLINVCVREASGTERVIDDAIIIVDEAHNLDSDCRDTASIELSLAMLEGHRCKLLEFKKALQDGVKDRKKAAAAAFFEAPDTTSGSNSSATAGKSATTFKKQGSPGSMDLVSCVKAAESLIEFFRRLEDFMITFVSCHTLSDKRELPGPPLAQLLEKEVSARPAVTTLRTKLRAMRAGLVELGVESSAVKSSTINDSDNMLMRIEFILDDGGRHYTAFFTAPSQEHQDADKTATTDVSTGADGDTGKGGSRSTTRRAAGRARGTAERRRGGATAVSSRDGVLHLLCWSAAVAFRPVAKRASSVLLTSGTLHPMHLLQTEFFAPNTWPVAAVPASPAHDRQLTAASGAQANDGDPSAVGVELQEPPERLEFLQFSAPHFEAVSNNLLNLFVSEAPTYCPGGAAATPVRLLGDYRSRSDTAYLSALGGCVLRAASVVPKGLLVYLLRFKLM